MRHTSQSLCRRTDQPNTRTHSCRSQARAGAYTTYSFRCRRPYMPRTRGMHTAGTRLWHPHYGPHNALSGTLGSRPRCTGTAPLCKTSTARCRARHTCDMRLQEHTVRTPGCPSPGKSRRDTLEHTCLQIGSCRPCTTSSSRSPHLCTSGTGRRTADTPASLRRRTCRRESQDTMPRMTW